MSDSSKDGLLAMSGSLMGLSSIAVGLRFWTRRRHNLPLMADDWMAVAALLSYIGAAICLFIMVDKKLLGYSNHDFTPEEIEARGRTNAISEITLDVLNNNTIAFVKLSALFFYRRIFCADRMQAIFGFFSLITWVTIVVVILWLLLFQVITGFQCGTHFSALWDGTYTQYCTISFPLAYGFSVSDFLLDVWILALPIPGVLGLCTSLKRKLTTLAVFLLALVGVGASAARMVQTIKVELGGGPHYLLTIDPERTLTQGYFYIMLECGMTLIAVNLPSLHVLVFSLKTGGFLRSVRSIIELLFLRSRSSDNGSNASGAGARGEAPSLDTCPSESSKVPRHDFDHVSQSMEEGLARPSPTAAKPGLLHG